MQIRSVRIRLVLAVVCAVAAAAAVSCSSNEGADPAGQDGASTTSVPAPPEAPVCDQGATLDEVETAPVDGIPSDLTVTSFDGTALRVHWFPTDVATAEDPAPTVLMGPGWSLAGDTSTDGAALFGAASIGGLNEAGYHVLTWDPRGFGASDGVAQVNDPDHEGRDVQVLLDWVAEQPTALTDAEGDPRIGMVGFSYGGGIQLTVAAIDCRVDAIVPGLAWSSLESSLFKAETVKTGWAGVLVDAAVTGTVDPHVTSAYESGTSSGVLSAEDREWFLSRGPGRMVEDITIPTLFVSGTVDTLFTLDEAISNHAALRSNEVPTAMLWFCGGHGTCRTEPGDATRIRHRTFAWLDHHLSGDATVDVGAGFEFVDQDGASWTAPEYPPASGDDLFAEGSGTLALVAEGGSRLEGPTEGDSVLDGLVWGITPGPATNAVEVRTAPVGQPTMVLGAPTLRLTYSGSVGDGERPTRVFAQLVDDERGVVVGNQVTPIALRLDGRTSVAEIPLEVVAQHLDAGETLTLQLVATTVAYATPRLGGEVAFERIELTLPTAEGLTRLDGTP